MTTARKVLAIFIALLLIPGIEGCRHPSPPAGPVTSKDDAIARVTALPDVTAWIKLVQTKSPVNRIVVDVDSENPTTYTVHAYELVQDEFGGHSATFGWYEVAKATGVVHSVMP